MSDHDDQEAVARYIAARKMGLVKDPTGARLPDSLWHRYRDQAATLLATNDLARALDLIDLLVEPAQ